MPLNQEIPGVWYFTDQGIVFDPREAVQVSSTLPVYQVQLHALVGFVSTVPQHHAAPVLPRVDALSPAGEFGSHGGLVVMVHTHQSILVINHIEKLGNVAGPQEVIVDEHGPALVVVQIGDEETTVGELSALLGVLCACVDTACLHLCSLQRNDFDWNGGILQDGIFGHLESDVLMTVVANVDAEWMILCGILVSIASWLFHLICLPFGVPVSSVSCHFVRFPTCGAGR
mmetsp:Transcript_5577/g.6416  ORF Transcript_5577/g.6416 Transcript_5577/m.6416 type:complete len:229 (+) Transcript_5577:470-1156(+)